MESWRDIAGYEGYYQVSDAGRVRSMLFRNRGGLVCERVTVMSTPRGRKGYRVVNLHKCGRSIYRVHRLVLGAFRGPCPAGCEGSHLDGDSGNNILENLVWETPLANSRRRHDHGTTQYGEQNPSSKLTDRQVDEIRESSVQTMILAERLGVSKTTVREIRGGRRRCKR